MKVLIFRPENKIEQTCLAFQDAGIQAAGVPLLRNIPLKNEINLLKKQLEDAPEDSILIFVSTTSATLFVEHIQRWPKSTSFFAVGKSTGAILSASTINVVCPQVESTEGLLSQPQLQQVTGRTIILVKGQSGRQDLYAHLTSRGAKVIEANIYYREKIAYPNVTKDWNDSDIKCIIATSGELIQTAFDVFSKEWLKSVPWIVVSNRTAKIATDLGVKNLMISQGAQTDKLIFTTQHFLEQ